MVTSHCLVGGVLPLCIFISSPGGVGTAAVAAVTALIPPLCPTSQLSSGFERQAAQDKFTTAAPKAKYATVHSHKEAHLPWRTNTVTQLYREINKF